MRIYYRLLGAHYHMRVFINGAKSGDLCVRQSEWNEFCSWFKSSVVFMEDPIDLPKPEFKDY